MLDLRLPPPHPLISSSILSADFGRIAEETADVLGKGVDLVHIDVMDGHFVANLTMGPDMVRGLRRHFPDTFLDVHLMVERPDIFVDSFADAGANLISFHLEVCQPLRPVSGGGGGLEVPVMVEKIRKRGLLVGLASNPATPAEHWQPWLSMIDLALVMSVNPGRSGQVFMPAVVEKVAWLKSRVRKETRIELDGGINPDTARLAVGAGGDVLVMASALFGAKDRAAMIKTIHATGQNKP